MPLTSPVRGVARCGVCCFRVCVAGLVIGEMMEWDVTRPTALGVCSSDPSRRCLVLIVVERRVAVVDPSRTESARSPCSSGTVASWWDVLDVLDCSRITLTDLYSFISTCFTFLHFPSLSFTPLSLFHFPPTHLGRLITGLALRLFPCVRLFMRRVIG